MSIIIPVRYPNEEPRTAPVFGDSSGYTNGSPSDNPSNAMIKYVSGDTSGAPINIPNYDTGSNTIDQPSSDPDSLKQGIQEAQVSLQRNPILFILHIIFSL